MTDADQQLSARVERALSAHTEMQFERFTVTRLSGGACQDNFLLDATVRENDTALGAPSTEQNRTRKWVLRSDAPRSLPGSLLREHEAAVMNVAAARGVRTPKARWIAHGWVAPGRGSYVMDWVEGEAIGRRVVKSAQLAQARETLGDALAHELAKIHRVTPSSAPELRGTPMDALAEADPAQHALRFLREMLAQLPEPHPAIELATRWLEANTPSPPPTITLVHGDFRTGNFMLAPTGLTAVLDWEFAHWGDPAEDLSWLCVRDWRFGELRKPVGGVCAREPFYQAYAQHGGQRPEAARLRWWEVMGNVRWAAGSILQGERYLSGDSQDIELLAIARRACEMEWEALRLIRQNL
jgi:aminoglycoside phosphotransferase (APT) family kinase protein